MPEASMSSRQGMNVRRLTAILLFLMPLTAAALPTLPQSVNVAVPDLRLQGEGRLRWFGLLVYDATLWAAGSKWDSDQAFALDIRYARNISAKRLIGVSVDEMRRLGFGDESTHARWAVEMRRVFPDVAKGERLTGVNIPGEGASFYHNGRLTGTIRDPDFARAFFAIWLDPRTREPELRESLIGIR